MPTSTKLPFDMPGCKKSSDSSSDGVPVPLIVVTGVGVAGFAAYLVHRYFSPDVLPDPNTQRSNTAASALSRAWIQLDPDPETRDEVSAWLSSHLPKSNASNNSSNNPSSSSSSSATIVTRPLLDSLDPTSTALKRLKFGTAGVRAAVGAGYDRLNALTVIGVAQAVSFAVKPKNRIVVIGYDARHSSKKFALLIAQVFQYSGAIVHLFSQHVPTPFVAYYGLASKAIVSLVVTASHNPRQDNGIKVYDSDAIQLRSESATKIESLMPKAAHPWKKYSIDESDVTSLVQVDPFRTVRTDYVKAIVPVVQMRTADENSRAPLAVYTACHGVGYEFIQDIFEAFGLPAAIPCEAQCEPDGDFPTLPFPNPEEKGALDLAIQTAKTNKASIILANDPDADRFAGGEVSTDGTVRVFSGDEIATLFVDYITTQIKSKNKDGSKDDLSEYAVVTSMVSSKILASMAKIRGFSFHESLTGFKWLNKTAVDLQSEGKKVLLTYEEAIGFNVTRNIVRDKDGISAAAMFYEMAGFHYESKQTLVGRLREVIDECGMHIARNGYLRLSNESPSTNTIFEAARNDGLPTTFGDAVVISYRDVTNGIDTAEEDQKSRFPPDPSSQFITFRCAKSSSKRDKDNCPLIIHLRGSGTEPKIKFYSELRCSTVEANNGSGERFLQESVEAAIKLILKPDTNHLTR